MYSLSEGDTLKIWRVEPFVMVAGGQRWVPPTMTSALGTAARGELAYNAPTAASMGGSREQVGEPGGFLT